MFTFIETFKVQYLPEFMIVDLLRKAREFILDKKQDDVTRYRAIDFLYRSAYAEDFLDCFISISNDDEDYWEAKSGALLALQHLSEKNQIAAESLVSSFLKHDAHSKFHSLGGGDGLRFRFPLDDHMRTIKSALLDKSLPSSDRERIMSAVNKSLSRESGAYIGFTNATIGIAEDVKEKLYTRVCAMWTLDPVKHKDVLWALKSDVNEDVRMEAIGILNRAALSK